MAYAVQEFFGYKQDSSSSPPTYSPDLASFDFFLLPKIKIKLKV
jgi:hypothetical protein